MKIKTTHPNPKDALGMAKLSLSIVPDTAIAHEAAALMVGAEKYGRNNWRDHPVSAMVYYDACLRHLSLWKNGEETSSERVHHLGHARACLAILLDAMEFGNLIDDREDSERSEIAYTTLLTDLNEWVKDRMSSPGESKSVFVSFQEYINEASETDKGGRIT